MENDQKLMASGFLFLHNNLMYCIGISAPFMKSN